MKKRMLFFLGVMLFTSTVMSQSVKEQLIYHPIHIDKKGFIIPWYSPDPGKAYDHNLKLVFQFWDQMRMDFNGLPYYMNHQVWNPAFNDPRGIGGDQFAMALSSWRLFYAYTGNERVKANMLFIADYYLSHGLSPESASWPFIPYPYNTIIYSGIYDGDMRAGKNVTQPDKAGSFGNEILYLYKMSKSYNVGENNLYLEAAIKIANTLGRKMEPGDLNHSPLPFKVNALNGERQLLRYHDFTGTWIDSAVYTSNWAPTMELFLGLIQLQKGDTALYRKSFYTLLDWMKKIPLKNNKWGPFFEDVDWWSDTQINAMTFARFIMTHQEYFPDWKTDVQNILLWVHQVFGNHQWKKYGVEVTNEQTVYQMPANSHSARQASDEILYTCLSHDSTYFENAVRELNWATYMVDIDGKNRFPGDEPWLTDGYGDYVRHYLRAMDACPDLAPSEENHILSSSTTIQEADYAGHLKKFYDLNFKGTDSNKVAIFYRTYEDFGIERIRLTRKPKGVLLEGQVLKENGKPNGYTWTPLKKGGVLTVFRKEGENVIILK